MLTQKQAKERFNYNPKTGIFIHLQGRRKGKIFGTKHYSGYMYAYHKGKHLALHRLAFVYMTGAVPIQVDHKNGIRYDNIWTNLKASTNSLNTKNACKRKDNIIGCTGVTWNKNNNNWRAIININKKPINLGSYKNKQDAIDVRLAANKKYGFSSRHGT